MRKILLLILVLSLGLAGITGCSSNAGSNSNAGSTIMPLDNTNEDIDYTAKIVLNKETTIEGSGASRSDQGVTITSGGTYGISGTLEDGMIQVDAADQLVTLVLNGVSITNSKGPAILFKEAKEGIVALKSSTTNKLEDGGSDEHDAALYSKPTLTIQGKGNLIVSGNNNEGISSQMHINIKDGNIRVKAIEDGLNANNDNVSEITVSGGYLYVESQKGDGIDSNGAITITGGTVISLSSLADASGGLDADGKVTISGGTVIATGAQLSVPSIDSSQKSLFINNITTRKANTLVSIQKEGKSILLFAPAIDYQQLLFSSNSIEDQASYDVYSGGSVTGDMVDGLYRNATYQSGTKISSITTESVANNRSPGGGPVSGGIPPGERPEGTLPGKPL